MAVHELKAMLPGVFYRKPSPDEPNYKEVGETVTKGEVIGLIEVMKSYHQVAADVDGKITAFPVDNEDPITPGTTLAEVEV